jgi:hypothetical protein
VYPNNSALCDDGSACTLGDQCDKGNCKAGVALVCNDNNLCTLDTCDPLKACVNLTLTGTACNDGKACTTNDVCDAGGSCKGGAAPSCDDNNVCTTDSCDSAKGGCQNVPVLGTACNDGDATTINDVCGAGGKCKGSSIDCDDGDACTVDSGTTAQTCAHTKVVCDDGNSCTANNCDSVKGCLFPPSVVTVTCDDGNPCTSNDVCSGGTCASGAPKSCDDGNPCTADSCDKSTGCVYALLSGGVCDDKDQYTTGDICAVGVCKGTPIPCDDGNKCTTDSGNTPSCTYTPIVCDDGNSCTTNSCDSASGCVFLPTAGTITCDDGNICTLNDVCASGTCISGAASKCDDGDPCTVDACDPKAGACKYSALLINGKQCGVGEVCANGIDDDGDGKTDCQDSECKANDKAIILHSYGPTGATVDFVTADKPGNVQNLPVGAWQIYCGELPVSMTLKSTKPGTLFAWVEGPSGTTPEEKIKSAPKFWAFDIFESIFDLKPSMTDTSYQKKDESFKVTWPPSKK